MLWISKEKVSVGGWEDGRVVGPLEASRRCMYPEHMGERRVPNWRWKSDELNVIGPRVPILPCWPTQAHYGILTPLPHWYLIKDDTAVISLANA